MFARRKINRLCLRIVALLVGLALIAACRPTPAAPDETVSSTPERKIRLIIDPMFVSDADALAAAEAVFLGEVMTISPTRFNQDSGAYWADAQPIHTVTLHVVEPIIDAMGLPSEVTLMVMAGSPIDAGTMRVQAAEGEAQYKATVSHSLTVGQEVVLARQNELTWRGGLRETVGFAVWAGDSYFASDGEGKYRRHNSELPLMTLEELSGYIRDWRAENVGSEGH